MSDDQQTGTPYTRREFLGIAGAGAMALGLGVRRADATETGSSEQALRGDAAGIGSYNILFILTDQERYFRPGELPADYSLPAHERLTRQGTTFVSHRINSCVCTPSRSVL